MTLQDKASAALCAFALGDAMGMPTELISPSEIKELYGRVTELVAPDPKHYHFSDLRRGMITDDTELTLEVMDALVRNNGVSVETAVDAMVTWSDKCDVMNKTYLGPSSRRALESIRQGADPVLAGRNGTTDGAPMRILPIGILHAGDPERAAYDACTFCIPTHGSNIAMSGAAAIAAGVAEALETVDPGETKQFNMRKEAAVDRVLAAAKKGAAVGEEKGYFVRENRFFQFLNELLSLSERETDEETFLLQVYSRIGQTMESDLIVPVILTYFYRYQGDPMKAIIASVNTGGDTDTIGAITGGLCGAYSGYSTLDMNMIEEIEQINQIDLRQKTGSFLRWIGVEE